MTPGGGVDGIGFEGTGFGEGLSLISAHKGNDESDDERDDLKRGRPRRGRGPEHTLGVQNGVQFQDISDALRTKKILLFHISLPQRKVGNPAGGRAVAGSNPVSPITIGL